MGRDIDEKWMRIAMDLAAQAEGLVEPNPMVGCVIVRENREIGHGFHQKFGGDHAEVVALHNAKDTAGATAYVNLEPCCHVGKTGPCTQALIAAKIARVVVATLDPFPKVSSKGVAQLRQAGIEVDVGTLESEALRLNAPYFKRIRTGKPWVIAKWAMTLDGKIATSQGDSQWISSEKSREFVHRLRGRVDAIMIGARTAIRDRPQLTARPPGPRVATRIVFDRRLNLPTDSPLARSTNEAPVLLVAQDPPHERRQLFEDLGCEVFDVAASTERNNVEVVLEELARRGMTNVLLEGGSELFGSFFDAGQIDEVIAIVAPKLIGGKSSDSPIGGSGVVRISEAIRLTNLESFRLGDDVCIRGRVLN